MRAAPRRAVTEGAATLQVDEVYGVSAIATDIESVAFNDVGDGFASGLVAESLYLVVIDYIGCAGTKRKHGQTD